jgi:hypothetical protein
MSSFWLKYQDYPPIKLRTRILDVLDGEVAEVGDLIAVLFTPNPRESIGLPGTNMGPITLHQMVDGVIFMLPRGLPLTQVIGGQSEESPLIVRRLNDTLTMDEYMLNVEIPAVVYTDQPTFSNTSGNYPIPTHVTWDGFDQAVLAFIDQNHDKHFYRVAPPTFLELQVANEVQTLQPLVFCNLLRVASKCFVSGSKFVPGTQPQPTSNGIIFCLIF